jgi:hypothetical protein
MLSLTATLAATAIPFAIRAGLCLLLASLVGQAVRRYILLEYRVSLRTVEWVAGLGYFVRTGDRARLAAVPTRACRRYGQGLWLLNFDTSAGRVIALVDTRLQDPQALRRLGRRLGWGSAGHSGLPPAAS